MYKKKCVKNVDSESLATKTQWLLKQKKLSALYPPLSMQLRDDLFKAQMHNTIKLCSLQNCPYRATVVFFPSNTLPVTSALYTYVYHDKFEATIK